MAVEISEILNKIKERGMFAGIKRMQFKYDHAQAREIVLAIGRSRTPRFTLDDSNNFAYDNFIKWVMGDPSMQALDPETRKPTAGRLDAGIYVAGGTGTGKSWLLEIMSAFCMIDEPRITIGDVIRPLKWSNYRTDAICDEYTAKGDVVRFKTMQVLGLQDLGSEPRECLFMGNRMDVVGNVIESRGDRTDVVTIISSNIPLGHARLKEIYGDRVASRLVQMCNYFEIAGVDRRKAR